MKSDIVVWDLEGRGSLEFSRPHLNRHNWFRCEATLTWEGEVVGVELGMITPYRTFWRRYFDELAASIRGWDGERSWESEYGELDLMCRNDGAGTVQMTVVLRQPTAQDDEATATLRLHADDVARVARTLPAFLQLPD